MMSPFCMFPASSFRVSSTAAAEIISQTVRRLEFAGEFLDRRPTRSAFFDHLLNRLGTAIKDQKSCPP
jgi:hypothetical protein